MAAGRLDKLIANAEADIAASNVRGLDEVLNDIQQILHEAKQNPRVLGADLGNQAAG